MCRTGGGKGGHGNLSFSPPSRAVTSRRSRSLIPLSDDARVDDLDRRVQRLGVGPCGVAGSGGFCRWLAPRFCIVLPLLLVLSPAGFLFVPVFVCVKRLGVLVRA
jgi:hypothetical protein